MKIDDTAAKPYIALGGDYRDQGSRRLSPGCLPCLTKAAPKDRLELARWLTGPENPLTARVAVNRMWQEFFGRGLVRTSEDFGTQGEKPTHPELLDWLASEFRDSGWSMKRMHRLIVIVGDLPADLACPQGTARSAIPTTALLARQTRLRLPAELVRDSALVGERSAEYGDRWTKHPAAAAGGHRGTRLREQREVAGEQGSGSLPPRALHPLPAHDALPAADELRRAGFECRLHAALAVEHAAAGAESAERSGVLRGGARLRGPAAGGSADRIGSIMRFVSRSAASRPPRSANGSRSTSTTSRRISKRTLPRRRR